MTTLPVLGVPMESKSLKGMDSLLSIVQMPGGIPVGTLAIGKAGVVNAALLAGQGNYLRSPRVEFRGSALVRLCVGEIVTKNAVVGLAEGGRTGQV